MSTTYVSAKRLAFTLFFVSLITLVGGATAQPQISVSELSSATANSAQRTSIDSLRPAPLGSLTLSPLAGRSLAVAPVALPPQAQALMQFRSGGHVLGFTSEGMLVAGSDRLLKVSFAGAQLATPEAVASKAVNGILRSTYTQAPGAKVEAIRLVYNVPIEITPEGALTLAFATGTMHESAPIAWQVIEGQQRPVTVAFHKLPNNELGFRVGKHDPAQPLIIDPTLTWNSFLGGAGFDFGSSIATDTSGNVYVTGQSGATWGAPVRAFSGRNDAFVARLSAATGALTWNTFLGGAGSEFGYGIATDASGNVYVTGQGTATWGTPVRDYTAESDAFAARLDAATGVLTWNTFLKNTSSEFGFGIATDASGNVYVTGDGTTTWSAPVRAYSGGQDAFVARLAAPAPTFSAAASGTTRNLTLSASINIDGADAGRNGNVYLAAAVGNALFLHNGASWVPWSGGPLPIYSVGLLANQSIELVRNADLSAFVGTQIYVGYGLSENDMLANRKFGLVYTFGTN